MGIGIIFQSTQVKHSRRLCSDVVHLQLFQVAFGKLGWNIFSLNLNKVEEKSRVMRRRMERNEIDGEQKTKRSNSDTSSLDLNNILWIQFRLTRRYIRKAKSSFKRRAREMTIKFDHLL